MKLSVIIPTYNESATIAEIIKRVKAAPLPSNIQKEIIVVDDGSRDGTREILKTIPDIRYIFHDQNLGKGGAVKTGFRNATGDIVIIQDADLEYDPNDFSAMVKPILDGKTRVTNGVRIPPKRDDRRKKSFYWISWFGNHIITLLTNILYMHYAKEYEGCYKAFRKDLLDSIEIKTNNFDFDNELICKILKQRELIIDIPIRYLPRSYDEGKKINWRHGLLILKTIIRTRFFD